jgi:hypothetical protein
MGTVRLGKHPTGSRWFAGVPDITGAPVPSQAVTLTNLDTPDWLVR